jgi:nucleotide sugar dehydrogenase
MRTIISEYAYYVMGWKAMGVMSYSKYEVVDALKRGRICVGVVGLGRVGLPTAAIFAEVGAKVIGADINRQIVKLVNSGRCQFHDEPGLETLVEKVVKDGKFRATDDVSSAGEKSDVLIICVPTPVDEQKIPDYSAIEKACNDVAKTLKRESLVIIESTVGPGTVENMVVPLLEKHSGMKVCKDFGVASCPERGDPGRMLENLRSVPRIVGGIDSKSADVAAWLYEAAFGVKVVKVSNPKTANAVKLTENLFRDVNIALSNEFAILYEKLGIDTKEVIEACATKYNFMPHYPGPGVGGPCLPQNPYYLIVEGMKVGNIPYLVRMAREINDRMPEHTVMLVTEALNDVGKTVKGAKIAILGVAYKPNVHDIQLTPVNKIFNQLKQMGALITIYDPMFVGEEVFSVKCSESLAKAVKNADCIVIGTAHREFKKLDLADLAQLSRMPAAFVDARHVVDPLEVTKRGFAYRGVGRALQR